MRPKFSVPFGRVIYQPQTRWSNQVEDAVSERCNAFAPAHRIDEHWRAYISASQHATSVIAKGKTETWQVTCSSLFLLNQSILFSVLSLVLFHHFPTLLTFSTVLSAPSGVGIGLRRLPEISLFCLPLA